MAENDLFPTVDVPDFTDPDDVYDTEYKPSLKWNLSKGDFERSASGVVPQSDGKEAYQIWCVKCVATERLTCLAYSDEIGTEMEEASQEPDRDAIEMAIQRTIEEALMVNPRTQSVDNFIFSWEGGSVYITFDVTAVDDQTFSMETTISADE